MSSFKQFKIYNKIHAPDYKNPSAKSYGSNSYTKTNVLIGTSKTNSFKFLDHQTLTYKDAEDRLVFEFWVDGKLIKEKTYDPKTQKIVNDKEIKESLSGQQPIDIKTPVFGV